MLITNYRDYLALRTRFGYSTDRFNTLIGIGAQTKYAWKKSGYIKKIYKVVATALDERPELVEQVVDHPTIVNYEDFLLFRSNMIAEVGEQRFNELMGLSEQTVYSWKNRGFRAVYKNLANLLKTDQRFIENIYDRLSRVEMGN